VLYSDLIIKYQICLAKIFIQIIISKLSITLVLVHGIILIKFEGLFQYQK